jgi:hypothetical protein
MVQALTWSAVLVAAMVVSGCAAGGSAFTADKPAGFWAGLWHGAISVVTLIVGLFADHVRVYEVNNTGGWYDFGFLLGALCVWGGGSHTWRCRKKSRGEQEWEEIGKKAEAKLMRKIREWAEVEPDASWDEVEKKAEAKLKRKIREWAESDD